MSISQPPPLTIVPKEVIDYVVGELSITVTVTAVLVAIAALSMVLRMFVRVVMVKNVGTDDWSMVLAMVLYIGSAACVLAACVSGTSIVAAQDWEVNRVRSWIKLYKSAYTTWSLSLIATKFSIGFFFLRILGHLPMRRAVIWTLTAFTAVFGVAYCALITFTCIDIAAGDPTQPKCSIQHVGAGFLATYSGINILADVVLTVMGIHAIWTSKINAATKAVACLLVAMGFTGGVASAVRLSVTLAPATPNSYVAQLFSSARWCQIELSTAVIASNLAMIRPLFQLALSKVGLASSLAEVTMTHRRDTTGVGGGGGGSARASFAAKRPASAVHHAPPPSHRTPDPSSRVGDRVVLLGEMRGVGRVAGKSWHDDGEKAYDGRAGNYSVTVESRPVEGEWR